MTLKRRRELRDAPLNAASFAAKVPHLSALERAELATRLDSATDYEWRALAKALAADYLLATGQRVRR